MPRRAKSYWGDWDLRIPKRALLVRSRVAKCASTLFIRLVVVKWESVLVTLGDRHHLDGLVVIGSFVIIQRACGWPNSSCERLWVRREHLILARIKGELHPCTGAPTRTCGEWRLSDTLAKHRRVSPSLFTLSIYFEYLLCVIQYLSLHS